VVKSLDGFGRGPVGLVHTQKIEAQSEKPTSPSSWYPRDIGLAISAIRQPPFSSLQGHHRIPRRSQFLKGATLDKDAGERLVLA
jgi:hypothetical protein